jgi:transposase
MGGADGGGERRRAPIPVGGDRGAGSEIGKRHRPLHRWVRQTEPDAGRCAGLPTEERERLKDLERENRGLKSAHEILRKAAALLT